MDYLVIEGYREAAENFAREAGMNPQMDLDSIQNRMTIRNAIQSGDIVEAIERVNDFDPEVCIFLFFFFSCRILFRIPALCPTSSANATIHHPRNDYNTMHHSQAIPGFGCVLSFSFLSACKGVQEWRRDVTSRSQVLA